MLGAAAHAVGWPVPRGGSQAITDALLGHLRELGGEMRRVGGSRAWRIWMALARRFWRM